MRRFAATILTILFATACVNSTDPSRGFERSRLPAIVFLSDFGQKDDAVALCKGVMRTIAPRATVIDLTHEVRPFAIEQGAHLLLDAPGIYPRGSVFVVVVDPGVGTKRRTIAFELDNGISLVGPDNGVLALAAEKYGVKAAWHTTNKRFHRSIEGRAGVTFHGRDIFSPVAAHLAAGVKGDELGPRIQDWRPLKTEPATLKDGVLNSPVSLDPQYGNVWTRGTETQMSAIGIADGELVHVRLADKDLSIRWVKTFADVPQGEPLIYVNSRGKLSLALNQGNFAERFKVRNGDRILLSKDS